MAKNVLWHSQLKYEKTPRTPEHIIYKNTHILTYYIHFVRNILLLCVCALHFGILLFCTCVLYNSHRQWLSSFDYFFLFEIYTYARYVRVCARHIMNIMLVVIITRTVNIVVAWTESFCMGFSITHFIQTPLTYGTIITITIITVNVDLFCGCRRHMN